MDIFQVILPSGYGVRFRLLTPHEHDDTLVDAARITGKDAIPSEIRTVQMREAVKRMLVARTKSPLKSADELATCVWTPLNTKDLEMDGTLHFDKLFGAKDAEALLHLFRTYHELTSKEAEDIVGKVQPVSVG